MTLMAYIINNTVGIGLEIQLPDQHWHLMGDDKKTAMHLAGIQTDIGTYTAIQSTLICK